MKVKEALQMMINMLVNHTKTFADAYHALYYFEPNRHWHNLRYVMGMTIWLDGHPSVHVCTYGSYEIEIKDLTKLRVTEEEFDRIIAKIDEQQEEITTSDEEVFDRIITKFHKEGEITTSDEEKFNRIIAKTGEEAKRFSDLIHSNH